MENEKKMQILNRLVKDGSIDLPEALILLESEKEFIQLPIKTMPVPFNPWNEPYPNYPNPFNEKYHVTCNGLLKDGITTRTN